MPKEQTFHSKKKKKNSQSNTIADNIPNCKITNAYNINTSFYQTDRSPSRARIKFPKYPRTGWREGRREGRTESWKAWGGYTMVYTRSRLQCNRSLESVDITWALSRRGVAWSSPDIYQVLR